MVLVEIVMLVCSLSDPSSCREEHLFRETRGSLNSCMSWAPTEIAKWAQEHPAVQVKRWKCVYPDSSRHI